MSAAERREKIVAAMGEVVGPLYWDLDNELTWLWIKWKDFGGLFADRRHVETLNQTAPAFFSRLQQVLHEDVLLHICRMTDPATLKGKRNLTVMALAGSLDAGVLKNRVGRLSHGARDAADFAHAWRNRRIAHRGLSTHRNTHFEPLPRASSEEVEQALAAISDVLHAVEDSVFGTETAFHLASEIHGHGSMMYYLEKGLLATREEQCNVAWAGDDEG